MAADRYLCRLCSKTVARTKNDRYRSHTNGEGESCENSSAPIPDDLLSQAPSTGPADVPEEGRDYATCPDCNRSVKLTNLGYYEHHDTTLRGGERCPNAGVRFRPPKEAEEPAGTLAERNLAATPMAEASAPDASSGASTETSSPESTPTSKPSEEPQPEPEKPSSPTFRLGAPFSTTILQPASPFLQPTEWNPTAIQPTEYAGPEKPPPMGEFAKELATRIKELFYAYDNRKTEGNRSAQTTLGPSEIGTPCDRRLAMALMDVPPVNPGGDGWAAFVGTCGHVGMGEMLTFANAGTGRFAVELPLTFRSVYVPRGTTDALDRKDATLIDWKFMGDYSLKRFKLNGPSPTYRVQAHTYGLGATEAGEKVRHVAIVGLPRAGGSLDDMHVWTEKFDPKVARDALARVDDIAAQVFQAGSGPYDKMEVARRFDTADDCRYCPFHLKNDKEMKRGCPGS